MQPPEELWDLLDAHGNSTGKTHVRGIPLRPDEFHLVVDVWIRNSNGKYLISKRSPQKSHAGMWEATGGSALSGEDSLTAAIREALEEVGISLTRSAGRIIHRERRVRPGINDFLDIWLFNEDIDDVEPVCQPEEVSEARWATRDEILEMISAGLFISHLEPGLAGLE